MEYSISKKCKQCGLEKEFICTEKQFDQYCAGKMRIQDIFPKLSADDRELLTSGICGECFGKLIPEEENL